MIFTTFRSVYIYTSTNICTHIYTFFPDLWGKKQEVSLLTSSINHSSLRYRNICRYLPLLPATLRRYCSVCCCRFFKLLLVLLLLVLRPLPRLQSSLLLLLLLFVSLSVDYAALINAYNPTVVNPPINHNSTLFSTMINHIFTTNQPQFTVMNPMINHQCCWGLAWSTLFGGQVGVINVYGKPWCFGGCNH